MRNPACLTACNPLKTLTCTGGRSILQETIKGDLLMYKAMSMLTLLALLCLPAATSLQAQTSTGTISGPVSDESGAVIPNAPVLITNKATGQARNLTANAEGLYSA